jgi:hypothetical protein
MPVITIFRFVPKTAKSDYVCLSLVRSSVQIEQIGSHGKDLHGIWYSSIFRKCVGKVQESLKFYIDQPWGPPSLLYKVIEKDGRDLKPL